MLRHDLERLLRETTISALAFAIALGWSLFQAASGLAYLITTAFVSFDNAGEPLDSLTLRLGDHILAFAPLVQGLIEFAVVLLVILLVRRSLRPTGR